MQFSQEQIRSSIFLQFRNNKTTALAKAELDAAFGMSAPTVQCIRAWYKRFRDGCTTFKEKHRTGRPRTAVTTENIDATRAVVMRDPNATYSDVESTLSIGAAAANTILRKELSCRKLVCRWIPHELTDAQKRDRVNWSKMMIRIFRNGQSRRVHDIVTGDETWICFRKPKTKQENMSWTFENQPPPTALRPSRWVKKRMFAFFFRKSGFVAKKMLNQKEKADKKWYKGALSLVFRNLKKTRPKRGLRCIIFAPGQRVRAHSEPYVRLFREEGHHSVGSPGSFARPCSA